jgi:hypothetical protein
MYHVPVKNWMRHMHIPKRHDMVVKVSHMVHDERFWAVIGALILLGFLMTLAIFAAKSGDQPPIVTPGYPYFP